MELQVCGLGLGDEGFTISFQPQKFKDRKEWRAIRVPREPLTFGEMLGIVETPTILHLLMGKDRSSDMFNPHQKPFKSALIRKSTKCGRKRKRGWQEVGFLIM
jgi:hypothetical protein